MPASLRVGQRVRVFLGSQSWQDNGWFEGTVVAIEPYSQHRNFYWVELDAEPRAATGGKTRLVSVLNPKNIQPLSDSPLE